MTFERDPLNDILHVYDAAPDLLQLACYWVSEAQAQKHLVDVASFDRDHWMRRFREVEALPRQDAAELEQLREENRRLLQRVTELEASLYDATTPHLFGGGVVQQVALAGTDVMRHVVTSSAWEGEGPEDAS